MNAFFLFILSIIPGLLLMWLFFRADRYEKEPAGLVWGTFFIGFFSPLLLMIFSPMVGSILSLPGIPGKDESYAGLMIYYFFRVALLEEGVKLIAILPAYRNRNFNEAMDGIVYGAAAAAGFATYENIHYVMEYGMRTGLVRAVLSVPLHVFATAISGFFLGFAKFSPRRKPFTALNGLMIAVVMHGLFNSFASLGSLGFVLITAIVVYGFFALRKHIRTSLHMSPFKALAGELPRTLSRSKEKPLFTSQMKSATGWLLVILALSVFAGVTGTVRAIGTLREFDIFTMIMFGVLPLVGGLVLLISARRRG